MNDIEISEQYPIGNTGLYIDPVKTVNSIYNWAENTPRDVMEQQITTVAIAGLTISAVILLAKCFLDN